LESLRKWDPQETEWIAELSTGNLFSNALDHSGDISGPILDVGCSVGGATFAAAAATDELVLGVDIDFSMVQFAQGVLRTGVVDYPLRKCGIVYDRRRFEMPIEDRGNVDFWACDAMVLPFAAETFSTAIGFNTLDSVASPLCLLESLRNALAPGGKLILACPYDWSVAVTSLEHWIGGHSRRGTRCGSSDGILEDLLTPGAHPASIEGLRLVHQSDDSRWRVRWHNRGTIDYRVHLVVADRI
jgi:SAM-dependent methyltransferase